jgi:hypothetical protein
VNVNNAVPAVGKSGASGCMTEVADLSAIDHAEFGERVRVHDGGHFIEPYRANWVLSLRGTLFAPTRGELYDALQVTLEAFNPRKALMESPGTKGFLPLTYYEPHDSFPLTLKTLQARPLGLHWQADVGTAAKVAGKTDATALALPWSVDLLIYQGPPINPEEEPPIEWPPPPEIIGPEGDAFVCVPQDYLVYTGSHLPAMSCTIQLSEAGCSSDHTTPGPQVYLYAGATYRITYDVIHDGPTCHVVAFMADTFENAQAPVSMGSVADPATWGPPKTHAETTLVAPRTREYYTIFNGIGGAFCWNWYSSIETRVTYVSGPDPRFLTLPLCANGDPSIGQTVEESLTAGGTSFFTMFNYETGTVRVFVDGAYLPGVVEVTGGFVLPSPVLLGTVTIAQYRHA